MKAELIKDGIFLGITRFDFDYPGKQLISAYDKHNTIPFSDFKKIHDGTRTALYDKFLQNLDPSWKNSNALTMNDADFIRLPERIFQGPFSHDKAFIEAVNKDAPAQSFRLVSDDDRTRLYDGKLTTVLIADQDLWTVDARIAELRNNKQPWINIKTDYLDTDHTLENMILIYDKKRREQADVDWDRIIEIPKDVTVVKLKSMLEMDPVGQARREGVMESYFLVDFPVKPHFKSETVPWEETPVHQIIARNRKAQGIPDDYKPEEKQKKGQRLS